MNIFNKLLICFFLILCISCSSEKNNKVNQWMQSNQKIKVLSTIEMINDLVCEIGGDRIDAISLIIGDLDPHSYEIVKGDDEKIQRADLVLYNGIGLEHGASLLQVIKNHKNTLAVGDVILSKYPQEALYINQTLDPHIWMDVSLWIHSIDPIIEQLSILDPEGAEQFKKNGKNLKEKLFDTHQIIFQQMQSIPSEKRYLVTSHDAFNYFARAYLKDSNELDWSDRFSAPEGLAPDGQLSSSNIKNIIDHVKKHNVFVLFPESNVSQDSIRKILNAGKKMGMNLIIAKDPLYGDAMQVQENLQGKNYINMMLHNAMVIKEYLNL